MDNTNIAYMHSLRIALFYGKTLTDAAGYPAVKAAAKASCRSPDNAGVGPIVRFADALAGRAIRDLFTMDTMRSATQPKEAFAGLASFLALLYLFEIAKKDRQQ